MLNPNTILQQGRYRVIRHLGHGGMGAVYEAVNERVSSFVALKATFASIEAQREAFEHEAKLLGQLDHEAFPRIIDHFFEGDGQYLVMELVRGNDLLELLRIKDSAFPIDKVLDWADQILDALETLHSHTPPIIHRDIKPANLKLTPRGKIKILDFGIAKGTVGQMTSATLERSIVGFTPHYAPIEQILRSDSHWVGTFSAFHPKAVDEILSNPTDARSDIFSLAATLYHLLTNTAPKDSPTRTLAVWSGKHDPLIPANLINAEIPAAVAEVISKAMSIERTDRFASAFEMRIALKKAYESTFALVSSKTTKVMDFVPGGTGAFGINGNGHKSCDSKQTSEPNYSLNNTGLFTPTNITPDSVQFSSNQNFTSKEKHFAKTEKFQNIGQIQNDFASNPNQSSVNKQSGNVSKFSPAKFTIFAGASLAIILFVSILLTTVAFIWKGKQNNQPVVRQQTERILTNKSKEKAEQSFNLFKEGKFKEAIQTATEAINLDPQNAKAFTVRGSSYLMMNSAEKAINDLNEAIRIAPDNSLAYRFRSAAYFKTANDEAANKDLDKVVQLITNPVGFEEHEALGFAYWNRGDNERAINYLNEAIKLNPSFPQSFNTRGLVYNARKQLDLALKDFDAALRLFPEYVSAILNKSDIYRMRKEYDKALEQGTKAVQIAPTSYYVFFDRGLTYLYKNQYDNAISDYNEAIRLNPNFAEAFFQKGWVYHIKKNYDQAISNYTEAIRLAPNYTYAYLNRGTAYFYKDKFEEAVKDFTEAIRTKPDYALAYSNRAITYRQLGKTDLAKADDKKAKELKSLGA